MDSCRRFGCKDAPSQVLRVARSCGHVFCRRCFAEDVLQNMEKCRVCSSQSLECFATPSFLSLALYKPSNTCRPAAGDKASTTTSGFGSVESGSPGKILEAKENDTSMAVSNDESEAENCTLDSTLSNPMTDSQRKKRNPIRIPDWVKVVGGCPVEFKCTICSKVFKTRHHIKYHAYCKDGERPFNCAQCDKGFISKTHFKSHQMIHAGEMPFDCPSYPQKFVNKSKLQRHLRTHDGKRSFSCPVCNKVFHAPKDLIRHELVHSGLRPFKCLVCGQASQRKDNLL